MIEVRPLCLPGVVEIMPLRHGDQRGFFSETWREDEFKAAGLPCGFVQDNHSYSASAGVLRGLHYQLPPCAQDKLVRVTRGRAFDVAVDIRRGSPTFGKWAGVELSAEKWNQLLVPQGFAHGFLAVEPDTELFYKVTDYYSPKHERSIRFDDPQLGIDWPLDLADLILSDRDRAAPLLAAAELFEFNGRVACE